MLMTVIEAVWVVIAHTERCSPGSTENNVPDCVVSECHQSHLGFIAAQWGMTSLPLHKS